MLAVFKRELKAYFSSATGYVFMGFFLLLSGFFFAMINLFNASPNYNSVLGEITFIFLIVVPILTMRLMSEEARQKTDQLLLTSPLRLSDIVLGKYFAAVAVFLLTLLITCLYPIILSFFGKLAVWEIIGGYIGFFLLGSSFISIGLFISSLTENQVISAVVTFTVLILLWVLSWLIQALPTSQISGIIFAAILVAGAALFVFYTTRNIYVTGAVVVVGAAIFAVIYFFVNKNFFIGFIGRFFEWFSLLDRYNDFQLGLLSLSPIVYYITFSAAFIFMTVRTLEKKRWS